MKHTALLIFLSIFTFASSQSNAEDTKSQDFTIGVSIPLTGDLAEYGSAVRNGIELAKSRFHGEFEHIHLIFEDNRYDGKTSLTIFQKFQARNVDLIYSWGEIPLNAVGSQINKSKIPVAAYSLDQTSARHSDYITLTSNDPKSLTAPLVQALRQKGFRRYGVVKMEDPYINACVEGFKSNLLPDESLEVISVALPGEMDMKPHALRAKSAKVDAVGIYLYPGQISSMYRVLGSLGVKTPTFGTDIFESRSEIGSAGEAMEGAFYPNFKMPDWFPKEYVDRYNDDAQIAYAYNAYAWAAITASVLGHRLTKLSPEEIVTAFRSVNGNEGAVTFHYNSTPDGVHLYQFPIVVKRVKDGRFDEF